jgi:hypothetical protein
MNHAGSLTSLPGAARLTDDGGAVPVCLGAEG